MKKLGLLLILFFLIVVVNAQPTAAIVDIHFKKINSGRLLITIPVNNTLFWGALKREEIPASGVCKISLNKDQTGYININVPDYQIGIHLFVQKGDKIKVEVDTANKQEPVQVTGNFAEGQNLFSRLSFEYVTYVYSEYNKDTVAFMLKNHIATDKNKDLEGFEFLYKDKKINKTFFEFVKLHLDYYYASLLTGVICNRYNSFFLPKNHPLYKPDFPEEFRSLWEKTYEEYPLDNLKALQTPGFNDGFGTYINNYISWYLTYLEIKKGRARVSPETYKEYIEESFNRIYDNLSNKKIVEFAAAGKLYFELYQDKYQIELLEITRDFNARYPHSPYGPYIQQQNDKIIAFYKKGKEDFTAEQVLLTKGDTIHSFVDLVARFKGEAIFIDMWATWCGPCKQEFKYKNELEKFLKEKNVRMLFISMDEDNKDSLWKNMIKYYDLQGMHVRTTKELRDNLCVIFWKANSYSIPRYVFINKEGKIAIRNALRPSDKEKLYRQIANHLK